MRQVQFCGVLKDFNQKEKGFLWKEQSWRGNLKNDDWSEGEFIWRDCFDSARESMTTKLKKGRHCRIFGPSDFVSPPDLEKVNNKALCLLEQHFLVSRKLLLRILFPFLRNLKIRILSKCLNQYLNLCLAGKKENVVWL